MMNRGEAKSFAFDVIPTRSRHAAGIHDVVRLAHGVPLDRTCRSCMPPDAVAEQLERFPEGQFVAVTRDAERGGRERVIGAATLMRTHRPPTAPPLRWIDMIGSPGLRHHQPDGEWLYGVEMSVHPDFQGRGVGSALYKARLAKVRELGLRGLYAGGMLKGYRTHVEALAVAGDARLSPREYAERVIRGELTDPTVSMQLNRGFQAYGVIEDYEIDAAAGNCAVLIAWEPADARRRGRRARRVRVPAVEARP